MIVKVDKLSHDLRGITKINNKITFVSDVLPNEIVDVKIINEKKNFNEAKVISYIEKSSDRIENKCPYSDKCGGCDFGYLNYKTSLMYKKNMVVDVMKRYAGLDINPSIISSDNIFGYRNKISLRINDGKLCLIEKNSNDYISISRCLLVNDNINKVIGILNDCDLYGIRDIVIRGTDEIMVIINGDDINNDIICRLDGNVSSIVFNGNVIYGKEYINILVDKFKYAIYPNSFFQVNTDMIRGLYDEVKESAGSGHSLLDLYCGAGTIGIYLADNFDDVHGIEINEDAVTGANVNKKINNIKNISFDMVNANSILINNYDVIVVDPPRGGLDKKTINNLLNSGAKKIVYVSCNTITLARDIDMLKDKYVLDKITLFDNFPNTKHVETVVLLSHKKPDGHINVKVEFGEGEGKVPLDNIAKRAEEYKPKERVTYKMIKEYIEAKYGFKVHTAYIAEVKRDLGLPMYDAPNAVEELKQPRKHPTAEKVEAIKDALKHFEVI